MTFHTLVNLNPKLERNKKFEPCHIFLILFDFYRQSLLNPEFGMHESEPSSDDSSTASISDDDSDTR